MSSEEKIQPEEFDKELERLMSDSGEKKGRKKSGRKKKAVMTVAVLTVLGIAGVKFLGSRET